MELDSFKQRQFNGFSPPGTSLTMYLQLIIQADYLQQPSPQKVLIFSICEVKIFSNCCLLPLK